MQLIESKSFKEEEFQNQMLSSTSSLSSSQVPDLPFSIWIEILSRLPIKSLIICRYVCKSWRSLLSETYFYKLFSQHMATTLILQVKGYSTNILKQISIIDDDRQSGEGCNTSRKLRFIRDSSRHMDIDLTQLLGPKFSFQVGNSCNGLVCLRDINTREPTWVWNPLLGQVAVLPKPATISTGKVVAGFGYCGRTNIYKVLRIYHKLLDPPQRWRVEIYDLGVGDNWREVTDIWSPIPSRIPGFYTDNCLHWILDYHDDDDNHKNDPNCGLIICFDFMEESFKIVSPPPIYSINDKNKYHWSNLGIISGCLSISAIDAKLFRADVQVWVMEEYGVPESWTLKLSICDPAIDWWDPYKWIQVTNIVRKNEVIVLCAHRCVLTYSLREREFGSCETLDFPAIAHVPSFISLEDVVGSDKGSGSWNVINL